VLPARGHARHFVIGGCGSNDFSGNSTGGNIVGVEGSFPSPFERLYHEYADSWRVPVKESLLSACGDQKETGTPKKPFYANNLEPQVYDRARAVCTSAGVKVRSLLDACTLDVPVICRKEAAKVFVGLLRAPTDPRIH